LMLLKDKVSKLAGVMTGSLVRAFILDILAKDFACY